MSPPLNVGIVGYGYATRTFHAPLVASAPGLRLAAVVTRDPARLHADWPEVAAVAEAGALFAQPELDVVVIATANDSHVPLAWRALLAGKHVVVDKPFTLTFAEARELAAQAASSGRLLSVFHNRRWDADFLTLQRKLIGADGGAAGPLGRVVHFESHFDRHRPEVRDRWRERSGPGAGLWYDLGPHLLDQAVQLFGAPRAIYLDAARQREGAQIADWFHAVLDYGPLRAILHAGMVSSYLAPRFVVHGVRGSAVKHGLDPQEDALRAGRRPPRPGAPGEPGGPGEPGAPGALDGSSWGVDPVPFELTSCQDDRREVSALAAERGDYPAYYAALRDAIAGHGPNPVPAAEAVRVMALLELGLESAAQRRQLPFGAA